MFDRLIETKRTAALVWTPVSFVVCAALAIVVPRMAGRALDSVRERLAFVDAMRIDVRRTPGLPDYGWNGQAMTLDAKYLADSNADATVTDFHCRMGEFMALAVPASAPLGAYNIGSDVVRVDRQPYAAWLGETIESARNGAVFDFQVDQLPELLHGFRPPAYPHELARSGRSGEVTMLAVIDASGLIEVESIRVVSASSQEFAYAAIASLSSMQFRPAYMDGHDVRMLMQLAFHFTPQERIAAPVSVVGQSGVPLP